MLQTQAKSITVHKAERILEIVWKDEHVSRFPLFGLRKACPCVFCKGGHDNMNTPTDPAVFFQKPTRIYSVQKLAMTGNYALHITWNDGHNAGHYRWEILRSLCPCKECKPQFYSEE